MKTKLHLFMTAVAVATASGAATRAAEEPRVEKRELRVITGPEREGRPALRRVEAGPVEKETVPFLGVETGPVAAAVSTQLGLQRGTGLVVNHLVPKSPAAEVLQLHDILLKLDDQILIETRQLSVLIRGKKEGDEVTLTYLRGGKQATAKAKLAKHDVPKFSGVEPGAPMVFGLAGAPERFEGFLPGHGAEREEVDRVLSLLQQARGVDAPPGQVPAAPRIRIERVPGSGVRAMSLNTGNSSLVYSDDGGVLDLRIQDGVKTLVAKDPKGAEIFSGPVTTPEERAKLPGELRARLEKLEGMRGVTFRSEGDVRVESNVMRPRGISLPGPAPRAEPRRMPHFL
jgi:hypothetical protein